MTLLIQLIYLVKIPSKKIPMLFFAVSYSDLSRYVIKAYDCLKSNFRYELKIREG